MAAKPKASPRPVAPPAQTPSAPLTLEERLHRIEAMRKRIDGYIDFMCTIPTMSGSSSEVKERAVTIFYEQMLLVESQLRHIHDQFRLE